MLPAQAASRHVNSRIWRNWMIGTPVKPSMIAYDHRATDFARFPGHRPEPFWPSADAHYLLSVLR
jgi:hypothetical protein